MRNTECGEEDIVYCKGKESMLTRVTDDNDHSHHYADALWVGFILFLKALE